MISRTGHLNFLITIVTRSEELHALTAVYLTCKTRFKSMTFKAKAKEKNSGGI